MFVVSTAAGKAKEAMGARETSAIPAMGMNNWFTTRPPFPTGTHCQIHTPSVKAFTDIRVVFGGIGCRDDR